jgi:hypothetical protein
VLFLAWQGDVVGWLLVQTAVSVAARLVAEEASPISQIQCQCSSK